MADYTTILTAQDGGVLTVTLNRPDNFNAFTDTLLHELAKVTKQASRDSEVRCMVITGAGRGFCAGQDLGDFGTRDENFSVRNHLLHAYHPMIMGLRTLEKPVIMAVNGACAGAGLGMALSGDIRYAAENAKFVAGFTGIGLVPDSGVSYWLPRLIGPARASEFLFTNSPMDATTAVQVGLINKVLPADELLPAVQELANKLAAGPTRGIGMTKRILNKSLGMTLEETLEYESHMQEVAGHTEDYKEGVAAFREKRKPNFMGR